VLTHLEDRVINVRRGGPLSDIKTAIAIPTVTSPADTPGTPCLVVYYGTHIGRRYLLDQPDVVVGRSDGAAIQVDEDSVSREHARLTVRGRDCLITDLASTNGTWVNDTRVETVELSDGAMVRIGHTVFKYLTGTNIEAKYHEAIYRLTTTDGLTGAVNKLSFLDALERELIRARHDAVTLSLALFDIDLFKHVNDTWGHLAGDHVLRELSRLVAGQIRPVDTFARYGGEEFALILPGVDREGARTVCERIRGLTSECAFVYDQQTLPITISFGIVAVDFRDTATGLAAPSPSTVIARADERLYEAKQSGRNRVCA
jgi:two-component system cell cycle response regulator